MRCFTHYRRVLRAFTFLFLLAALGGCENWGFLDRILCSGSVTAGLSQKIEARLECGIAARPGATPDTRPDAGSEAAAPAPEKQDRPADARKPRLDEPNSEPQSESKSESKSPSATETALAAKAASEASPPDAGKLAASLRLDPAQRVVLDLTLETAAKHGIDPHDFVAVAWIESRLRAEAKNPRSTASGVFQFIASTARAYGLAEPFDATANIEAGARLWLDNKRALTRGLGRAPTGAELYLAHQQGSGAALRLIRGGEAAAAALVGATEIALNRAAVAAADTEVSARAFVEEWTARFAAVRARIDVG